MFKIILIIVFIFFSQVVGVQSSENFGHIKSKVTKLLEENRYLSSRYNNFHKRFETLTAMVDEKEKEINEMKGDFRHKKNVHSQLQSRMGSFHQDISSQEDSILVEEAWNMRLAEDLVGFDEKHRLWDLQLEELKIQKQALEMDLKLKKMASQKDKKIKEETIGEIKEKLQKSQQQEKDILKQIAKWEQEALRYPQKVKHLNEDSERLERQIFDLQQRYDLKNQENINLWNKKFLAEQIAEDLVLKKKTAKMFLEEEIKGKKIKYKLLEEAVQVSLDRQDAEKKLVASIVAFDRKNQILRQRISELQEQLRDFE